MLRVIVFGTEMIKRFIKDRVLDLSAQCAYYFLLSFFPFLIFAITVLHYFPITADDVLWILGNVAPETADEVIRDNLNLILGVKHTGLMSFGIIFTIWSAILGIDSLIRALNLSYGIPERRGLIKSKAIAFLLMLGIVLGILSAFVFNIFGSKISLLMAHHLHWPYQIITVWNSLRLFMNLVILNVIFLALYLVAPKKRTGILEALPGSLFAAFGWHYTSLGFSYYVNNFVNFTATYGSLGAMVVLMIWFYLSAMILIIGGQINAVLADMRHC